MENLHHVQQVFRMIKTHRIRHSWWSTWLTDSILILIFKYQPKTHQNPNRPILKGGNHQVSKFNFHFLLTESPFSTAACVWTPLPVRFRRLTPPNHRLNLHGHLMTESRLHRIICRSWCKQSFARMAPPLSAHFGLAHDSGGCKFSRPDERKGFTWTLSPVKFSYRLQE